MSKKCPRILQYLSQKNVICPKKIPRKSQNGPRKIWHVWLCLVLNRCTLNKVYIHSKHQCHLWSVHKAHKHGTNWTVLAWTVKLGTLTSYNKRTTPLLLRVRGQGQMLNVVKPCRQDKNRIVWVRTVKLGTIFFYGKRMTPIDFRGQRSRSHNKHCCWAL